MSADLQRLIEARHHAPFEVLGPHSHADGMRLRVLLPKAVAARVEDGPVLTGNLPMIFEWHGPSADLPRPYRIIWRDAAGIEHREPDPYAHPCGLSAEYLNAFHEGRNDRLASLLGSHCMHDRGVEGVRFSVWAPHAERVSVIGEFNDWDGRRYPMQVLGSSGVWVLFVPGLTPGVPYRYEIRNRTSGRVLSQTDPMARSFRIQPRLESLITEDQPYAWRDSSWMRQRPRRDWDREPLAVYEVHLGSWRAAGSDTAPLRSLAQPLAAHLVALGFTHVELLPVMEHPFGGSWGYQTLGYFALAGHYGSADDLRYFVDVMHQHDLGVLLDWTPAHFPRDPHGLAWFDGEPLYEYADPRIAVHPDWDTAVFDYGRGEVRSFLVSSALHWIEQFHVDGLRVDAVASMLHRDYSRPAGSWLPNQYGGRENLEAVEFLRELNRAVERRAPDVLTIAEESTSWPMVTKAADLGGLGFSLKWNMGWMHDSLDYLRLDPVFRSYHHHKLTFSWAYAGSERFMLALSHDELVHGKSSLLHKMAGDDWQKFANLRLLYCWLYGFPGKKLMFMGSEIGVRAEWDHRVQLDWSLLEHAPHRGIGSLLSDLNRLYRHQHALRFDHDARGFLWIDCHDHANSVLAFLRTDGNEALIFVFNFTPVVRHAYRIGVPEPGVYQELLNTDSRYYGGSNVGNQGRVRAQPRPWMGQTASLELTLPPLGALVLECCEKAPKPAGTRLESDG